MRDLSRAEGNVLAGSSRTRSEPRFPLWSYRQLNRSKQALVSGGLSALTRANFLRRPAISLGAGAAHQHCPLTVAQAPSLKEGLDGLLVVDDRERACPVRPPQAAIETPGIEHAGERIPDV